MSGLCELGTKCGQECSEVGNLLLNLFVDGASVVLRLIILLFSFMYLFNK